MVYVCTNPSGTRRLTLATVTVLAHPSEGGRIPRDATPAMVIREGAEN